MDDPRPPDSPGPTLTPTLALGAFAPTPGPAGVNGVYHEYVVSGSSQITGYLSVAQTLSRCATVTDVNNVSVYEPEVNTPAPMASPEVFTNVMDLFVPYQNAGAGTMTLDGDFTPEPLMSNGKSVTMYQYDIPVEDLNDSASVARAQFKNLATIDQITDSFSGVTDLMFYPMATILGGPPNIWVPISEDIWSTSGTAVYYGGSWYGEELSKEPDVNGAAPLLAATYFPVGPVSTPNPGFQSPAPAASPTKPPPC